MARSASDAPLDLVKDLKANGADTVIGPLKWDEKGDLKGFEFGGLPVARRRLVNRREVMPEDKLSHRPHAGRV
nr:leucine-specific binding protein [Salmonella sp. NCTC 7297]